MGRILTVAVISAMFLSCSKSSSDTTGLDDTLNVTATVTPSPALPGDTLQVVVAATSTSGATIDQVKVTSTGIIAVAESLPFSGSGNRTATWNFALPTTVPEGSVVFTGSARSADQVATGAAVVAVFDSTPPAISGVAVSPSDSVSVGDTVTVSFSVSDNARLSRVVVDWTGAVTRSDTVSTATVRQLDALESLVVPANSPFAPLSFTIQATDVGNNTTLFDSLPLTVADLVPPVITGGILSGEPVVPTDSVALMVNAQDAAGMTWIGYELGLPASTKDSMAVADTSVTSTFSAVAQGSWVGSSSVKLFGVDRGGNRTEFTLGQQLTVINAVRRPTVTVELGTTVNDVAYDAGSGRLYFSVPAQRVVRSVSLPNGDLPDSIPVPGVPHGLDVSQGGDTLLVALRDTPYIAVIDVVAATVDTVRLTDGPDRLRLMANNKAIVSMTFAGTGFGGQIWEYDLGTGQALRRTDVGFGGAVTERTPMARSVDRKILYLLIDDSCCPEQAFTYNAISDSFSTTRGTTSRFFPPFSTDSAGSMVLMGNELFDSALNKTFTLAAPAGTALTDPTALHPSGQSAFSWIADGFVQVSTSDGALLDRVLSNLSPSSMWIVSSGDFMVLGLQNGVAVVDLR